MIKQLVRDALPKVIDNNEGAAAQFRNFVEKKIGQDPRFSVEIIALSITSRTPREQTLNRFITVLTQESLQSKDQIFQIAAIFDIPSKDIYSKPDDLRDVFKTRNKIIHELDIDMSDGTRTRVARSKKELVKCVNVIFESASAFLGEVDRRCG